eukprot:CAMPEP_0118933240 /NCGR_PEP_ID=MMETSP1169-20130426/11760_1 /TAXON_ID=36882 /ORGANISM="Pyramimonas obovata, Strain CCMP722" /LENGTH=218 /DNA_ID=CAMNT_0006875979 /DNA_START=343 /DNA_END=999 /DNA_ORIENTATION=+
MALVGGALSGAGPAWSQPKLTLTEPQTLAEARSQLLDTISAGGDYSEVERAIEYLAPFNPTPNPAQSPQLQGEWRLLWSSQSAEVTKATKNLPLPFESVQLVGPGGGMEAGRAANLVKVLGGALTLKLSSSAVEDPFNAAAVTIGPPFRLELLVGGRSIPLQSVESNDADPTALLGTQSSEFSQLYLEATGATGDVRVSKVTAGDDVVLNSTFVHVRI